MTICTESLLTQNTHPVQVLSAVLTSPLRVSRLSFQEPLSHLQLESRMPHRSSQMSCKCFQEVDSDTWTDMLQRVATKTNTIPAANPTITLTPKARRDRDERLDKCPGKAGTYAPSLISSACSCLVTPVSVVSRTVTASSLTVTEKVCHQHLSISTVHNADM